MTSFEVAYWMGYWQSVLRRAKGGTPLYQRAHDNAFIYRATLESVGAWNTKRQSPYDSHKQVYWHGRRDGGAVDLRDIK